MSRAVLKFVRVSPTKARLVAREVQGMNAELALASLEFMPNKAAGIIAKVIASAVANGEYEPEEVQIVSCRVDKAAVLKRWRPRARGSASRIIKPTSHIYVEVAPAKSDDTKNTKASTKASKGQKGQDPKPSETKSETKSEQKGDDLTKIAGIGKAYAQKLNDEGIYTIEDVANMSEEQIAMMEEKYSFKGDFKASVEDAKKLLEQKEA